MHAGIMAFMREQPSVISLNEKPEFASAAASAPNIIPITAARRNFSLIVIRFAVTRPPNCEAPKHSIALRGRQIKNKYIIDLPPRHRYMYIYLFYVESLPLPPVTRPVFNYLLNLRAFRGREEEGGWQNVPQIAFALVAILVRHLAKIKISSREIYRCSYYAH